MPRPIDTDELKKLPADDPVRAFATALGASMADLEEKLRDAGAFDWEAVTIAYNPKLEDAFIVVLSPGANLPIAAAMALAAAGEEEEPAHVQA